MQQNTNGSALRSDQLLLSDFLLEKILIMKIRLKTLMAGNVQTIAPKDYVADASSNEIARVALAWNRFWLITRCSINSVVIQFTAGYGDAAEDVPRAIRQGILIEVSNLYENREDVIVGQNISMLSLSERLLWPYLALSVE
jgi:uncharacterized phiE125 gp8 family phage protein